MKTALQMAVTILYLVYSDSQGARSFPFSIVPDGTFHIKSGRPARFIFQIKKGTEYAEKL